MLIMFILYVVIRRLSVLVAAPFGLISVFMIVRRKCCSMRRLLNIVRARKLFVLKKLFMRTVGLVVNRRLNVWSTLVRLAMVNIRLRLLEKCNECDRNCFVWCVDY